MRAAVIDLGTNTFNLVIAEQGEPVKFLYKDKIPVKLGEGGINENIIRPVPFERGIAALKEFRKKIDEFNCDWCRGVATSAIRGARNGTDFVNRAWDETGIEIAIIDGHREAELIFKGVSLGTPLNSRPSLIMDIGGGSTEFILASQQGIIWKNSYPLGAARLLEKFFPSEPIRPEEMAEMEEYFSSLLADLFAACSLNSPGELIGSSGSFDSFIEMLAFERGQTVDINFIPAYPLSFADYSYLHQKLIASTRSERMLMKGLVPMRVDMIVVATVLTHFILTRLQLNQIRVSTFSLKEGVLSEYFNHE